MNFSALGSIGNAYELVFRNLRVAFRISLVWLAAIFILALLIFAFLNISSIAVLEKYINVQTFVPYIFLSVLFISIVGLSVVAVGWHRYILRNEYKPASIISGLYYLWKLFVVTIVFLLIISILAVPVYLIKLNIQLLSLFLLVLTVPIIIYAYLMFFRLSLVLPAYAVGNTEFGFKDALEVTKNHKFKLFLQQLVFMILILLMEFVFKFLVGIFPVLILEVTGNYIFISFVVTLGVIFFTWFTALLSLSLLSTNYGFFVEKREFNA